MNAFWKTLVITFGIGLILLFIGGMLYGHQGWNNRQLFPPNGMPWLSRRVLLL